MLISRGAIQGILPSEINTFSVFLATLLLVLIQEMRAKAGGCSSPRSSRVWVVGAAAPPRATLGLGPVADGGVGTAQCHWVI